MIQHPAEGTLQAYLDGEIQSEPREAVYRHLDGCRECRDALAGLDAIAVATTRELAPLGAVDSSGSIADAARWEVRRAVARRRSHANRRRVAAAASVVLLVGAGWAAAMPGSPIRGWLAGGSPSEPAMESDQQLTGAVTTPRTGVSVPSLEGRVSVSFDGVGQETWIEVRVALAQDTQVSAPVGARFETGAGQVNVDMGGLGGDLIVEFPDGATLAEILVDGRLVFRRAGAEVSYPGPVPVPTNMGSTRLQVGGGP